MLLFFTDLQSDAFRDDTPTLPPSSAPALNWLNHKNICSSDDPEKKSHRCQENIATRVFQIQKMPGLQTSVKQVQHRCDLEVRQWDTASWQLWRYNALTYISIITCSHAHKSQLAEVCGSWAISVYKKSLLTWWLSVSFPFLFPNFKGLDDVIGYPPMVTKSSLVCSLATLCLCLLYR